MQCAECDVMYHVTVMDKVYDVLAASRYDAAMQVCRDYGRRLSDVVDVQEAICSS